MRYGFIGLGHLGGHLAGACSAPGFTVTVHDLDRDRAERPARRRRGLGRHRPAEVAAAGRRVITCLPSPAAVGRGGRRRRTACWQGCAPGGAWIEMSTNEPDEIARLAASAAARGHRHAGGAGHRRRAPGRGRRDHRAGRRRRGAVPTPPAGLRGDGRRGLPHGAARQRRGDQGDHQHAGLHPPGARPARR